jgi:hypothetical protein
MNYWKLQDALERARNVFQDLRNHSEVAPRHPPSPLLACKPQALDFHVFPSPYILAAANTSLEQISPHFILLMSRRPRCIALRVMLGRSV